MTAEMFANFLSPKSGKKHSGNLERNDDMDASSINLESRKVKESNKESPGLLLLNGLKYYRMEDYLNAKESLEQYSLLQKNTLVMQILAKIYIKEGNYDKGLKITNDLFIQSPSIELSRDIQVILLQMLANPSLDDPELTLATPTTGPMNTVKRLVTLIKSERSLDKRSHPSVENLQKALKIFSNLSDLHKLDWNGVLSDLNDLIARKHLRNLELHLDYLKLLYLLSANDNTRLLDYIDTHLDLDSTFLQDAHNYLSRKEPTPRIVFSSLNLTKQIAFKNLELGTKIELNFLLKEVAAATPILNSCTDGAMLKQWVDLRREFMACVELFEGYESLKEGGDGIEGLRVCVTSSGDRVRIAWGLIILRRVRQHSSNVFEKIFGGKYGVEEESIVKLVNVDDIFNGAITKSSLRMTAEIVKADLVYGKCRLQLFRTPEVSKLDIEGFLILLIATSTKSEITKECEEFWDAFRNPYGDKSQLGHFVKELRIGLEWRLYQLLAEIYTYIHTNTSRDCEVEVKHYKALVEKSKRNKSVLFGNVETLDLPSLGIENTTVSSKTKRIKKLVLEEFVKDTRISTVEDPTTKLVTEKPLLSSTPIKSKIPKPHVFANTPELLRSVPGFFPSTPIQAPAAVKKPSIIHSAIAPSPNRTPEMAKSTLADQSQDSFKIDPSFEISGFTEEEEEIPQVKMDWSKISLDLSKGRNRRSRLLTEIGVSNKNI